MGKSEIEGRMILLSAEYVVELVVVVMLDQRKSSSSNLFLEIPRLLLAILAYRLGYVCT